jgi:hypothetical protein
MDLAPQEQKDFLERCLLEMADIFAEVSALEILEENVEDDHSTGFIS